MLFNSEFSGSARPGHQGQGTDVDLEEYKYLVFNLKGESYGLPLLNVREVVEVTRITPIPLAERHFCGILNLRGIVVSVVDLKQKLDLGSSVPGPQSAILILEFSSSLLGVLVDSVTSVLQLEPSRVLPCDDLVPQAKVEYFTGVVRVDQGLVLLLDVQSLLCGADAKSKSGKTRDRAVRSSKGEGK